MKGPVKYELDAESARRIARIGGILNLVIIVIGALGEAVVRGSIVVPGDAVATATNLTEKETLWRVGIAGEIVLLSCATALAAIFYVLLRPVSRLLALMTLLFNLMCIAVEGVAAVSLAQALQPVSGAAYLDVFTSDQLGAMALLSIRAHTLGFGTALIFFGIECLLIGWLIVRSGYIPAWVGILMQIAGVCYLINSFALILSPPLASSLFPAILLPCLIGELSLALWLVIRGVRTDRWEQCVSRWPAET
jgi:hypothetical protein